MQALLNEILDQVRPLIGQGKVADYIPALADVPANQLGIAVYSNDGELYCAGDAHNAVLRTEHFQGVQPGAGDRAFR